MSDQLDEILTIDEVAAYLKAGKRTVYRLAASGKLPAFKLGGTWRFRRGDLENWIASRIGKVLNDDDGSKQREIVPVALADNGLCWHVRAYDRNHGRFGDFVLSRIIYKVQEINGPVDENELLGADGQWARIVEMELVPNPGVTQPKAIEADYGTQDGILRIKSRILRIKSRRLGGLRSSTLVGRCQSRPQLGPIDLPLAAQYTNPISSGKHGHRAWNDRHRNAEKSEGRHREWRLKGGTT